MDFTTAGLAIMSAIVAFSAGFIFGITWALSGQVRSDPGDDGDWEMWE